MKIMIDISAGLKGVGGVTTYVKELVTHLISQNSVHDLSLLINNMKLFNFLPEAFRSIKKQRLPLPRACLAKLWSQTEILPIEMFSGPLNIFHSPHALLPPLKKAKGILTVHDCTFFKYPNLFKYHNFSKWEYTKLLPVSIARATRIVVDSKATLGDLVNYFSLDERKIDLVPLGVSENFFNRPHTAGSSCLDKNQTKTFILSVIGTPEPRKNLPALLKAHRIFVEKGNQIPLWIVTNKKEAVHLVRNIVPESFIKKYVYFFDKIDEKNLIALLHDCFIFAYPSIYEGFGLPVLEAMAAGACVVAGNRGALPEVLGDTGVLVEPESPEAIANALIKLTNNHQMRLQFKSKAKNRAKEFTWEKTANRMMKIYEEAGQK